MSEIPYDCIAGYHLNYLTCGIAKFNLMLSEKMKVPFFNLYDPALSDFKSPLLSVKLSEYTKDDISALPAWIERWERTNGYSVFLHGYDGTPLEEELIKRSRTVFCGNRALCLKLNPLNANTHALWCPGTNMSHSVFEKTEITVFSFGMAHKLKTEKYYRLRELLELTGKSYSLLLSTALHEGTSFDESFIAVFDEMKEIFGDRVFFLGYLSDQAVLNQLREVTYFAAFFDGGLRANNTSVNTALHAGVVVITNLDDYSPEPLHHLKNIIDINRADGLPTDTGILNSIRREALKVGLHDLGWDLLVKRLSDV